MNTLKKMMVKRMIRKNIKEAKRTIAKKVTGFRKAIRPT